MSRMDFYIVDVFTIGRKYTGNQLAVYLGDPPKDLMQQLAKEINFSEITFVTSNTPEHGGFNVRIFMPEVEVPFAGHPVLGTAFVIRRELIREEVERVNLNLAVGQIPVFFAEDGVIWMRQNQPTFGERFEAADMARILNVDEEDIDGRFPIQEVSTGMPFVLAPMASLEAVKRAQVNLDRLRAMLGPHEAIAPAIFCAEALDSENDIHVRVLDDVYARRRTPPLAAPAAASPPISSSTHISATIGSNSVPSKDIRSVVRPCYIWKHKGALKESTSMLGVG